MTQAIHTSADDSSPTPIIHLGYSQLKDLFSKYAIRLQEKAKCLRQNNAGNARKSIARSFLDKRCARDCDRVAYELYRLCAIIEFWPHKNYKVIERERVDVDKQWCKLRKLILKLID